MNCTHCDSRNTLELDEPVHECHDCGRSFIPAGTPPTDLPTLLMRTREGLEVHGTLEAFSIHYPPAYGSAYCEDDSDCVSALFQPDDPSWDCVWADLAIDLGDMLTRYPYTLAPFGVMPGKEE